TDQYYTTVKAVPPYQQVRREFLDGRIPPSTSIAQQALLLPGADMNIHAMGAEPRRNGVATAALMAEGAQWGGQPIKLETEFIITKRMTASLALAGATLEDVVHAQVYLADRDDYS